MTGLHSLIVLLRKKKQSCLNIGVIKSHLCVEMVYNKVTQTAESLHQFTVIVKREMLTYYRLSTEKLMRHIQCKSAMQFLH